ncbi:MAG TPA: alpha-ketoglutarate-dependent dioxygenase AlkB [Terriglobales bacterium]|nr:alpha-ketoglutarate-dependent dioxygenase AlkB [Terriglobales bacterium]
MSQIYEPTLFDDEQPLQQPSINFAAFKAVTDHWLDNDSSITYLHGLVAGHDELMRQLSTLHGWEQRRRWMYDRMVDEPRLTHEYRDLTTAPPFLVDVAAALSDYCGVQYDGIWMNWYRDNRDSTSWHTDRPANTSATAVVPVLSLGAMRRFLIRPLGGGRSISFAPLGGDVLIMRGRCQRDWQHSVPKQRKPAKSRMSLNFSSSEQITP